MAKPVGGERKTPDIVRKRRLLAEYKGLLWILPGLALMLVFCYWPPITAFYYSATNYGRSPVLKFIGFDNFITLFRDTLFFKSVLNALILTVSGFALSSVTNILVAELLFNSRWKKYSATVRFLLILPMLVPGVVTMLLWNFIIMYPGEDGFINSILLAVGLIGEPLQFLHSADTVIISLIFYGFPWIGGTTFLIYLAGLQGIPESVIEASRLDGCSVLRRFFVIDLAFIVGQIRYFIIQGFIGGLQNYSMQLLITKGGPYNASMVPGYYMFDKAFNGDGYGYASAMGVVMFVILLVFTLIANKFIKPSEDL